MWNWIFTRPDRTYWFTTFGSVFTVKSRQNGHWRSANSSTVTGAFGFPSVGPVCGMPANGPRPPVTAIGTLGGGVFDPPPLLEARTAITTITAAIATAPISISSRRLRSVLVFICSG